MSDKNVSDMSDAEIRAMAGAESPADLMRQAASRLKELAGKATPGPWRTHDTWLNDGAHTATVLSGEGNATDLRAWLPTASAQPWDEKRNVWNDAAYIAAMGPQVGSPLADWLEATADYADRLSLVDTALTDPALAVARAVLDGAR